MPNVSNLSIDLRSIGGRMLLFNEHRNNYFIVIEGQQYKNNGWNA